MLQTCSSSVIIAIPARNEAQRIGACLHALHAQRAVPRFHVVLLANNCTDDTAALAAAWSDRLPGLHVRTCTLPPGRAHAGEARRRAMQEAAERSAPDGILLTTDADAVAPPDWIAANLRALRGVDAVAGRAVIDPNDAALIPPHLHDLDARECRYAALLDEIACLLAPEPHDPWPRHDEHSGASIAVRLAAWRAAGGIPRQPAGEDRAFFAVLRRTGARIRHAPDVWVSVSGRLDGRAQGGMADTIRARIATAPTLLDERLVPVDDLVARLLGARPAAPSRRVAFAELEVQMRRALAWRERLRGSAQVGLPLVQGKLPQARPVPADRSGSPRSRCASATPPDPRMPP
jgi:cellulose synthase/poly-beta-1,6-N-acetylglucosamine synthase-like glycosyltransferase